MVLKLYKREPDITLYWEAWAENEEIVIHFGPLGQMGETTAVPLAEFEPPETAINRHAQEARDAGFAEIDHEDLFELIVRYPQNDITDPTQVETLLNDVLGWTGLGYCDGFEYTDTYVNVYAFVVEPALTLEPLVQELRENNLLNAAVIAYQDKSENFLVLWPLDWQGVFTY